MMMSDLIERFPDDYDTQLEFAQQENKRLNAELERLERVERAARRLVEDDYCNDNNTYQALEEAIKGDET